MAANINQEKQKNVNKRIISESENEVNSWLQKISGRTETAEELIAVIISQIEAPPLYYKKVNEVFKHLKQIIQFFYRSLNVKVTLFGSSETKLAIKDSDVDIHLDFGENLPKPPEVLVKTLKNQVRKFRYFINSIPIFARVPIVHCVHRNRISCDLSFLNQLGVVNSYLIKFLLSIDERIRPLIIILKFLIKSQGLIGKNAISSFGLISLIVFFLQALEDPIIPAIYYLQSLSTKKKFVGNWDASFTTDISHLPTVSNQLSITELLQKFFEFYSTFEFGFYVISLFTAKKYLKPIFSDPALLPKEFQMYKAHLSKDESYKFECNKFMCVQGPFGHDKNVTRNVTQKTVIQFQNFCYVNAAIGQELLKKNKTEENKMKYLIHLLKQKIEMLERKRLKVENIVIFVGENLIFDNCNCTENDLRNKWSKHIFNTVKGILRKVMKCDINVQSKDYQSDNESTSFDDEKLINCKLHYYELLTKKRLEAKRTIEFPENISAIKKEEIVTNYLCNTVLKRTKKAFLKFTVICCVKKNPTCFCLTLESKETQKGNFCLVLQTFQFMQNYFPKWIK